MHHKALFFSTTCSILILLSMSESQGSCISKSNAAKLIRDIYADLEQVMNKLSSFEFEHLLNLDGNELNLRSKRSLDPESDTIIQNSYTSKSLMGDSTISQVLQNTTTTGIIGAINAHNAFAEMTHEDILLRLVTLQKNQWATSNLFQKQITQNKLLIKKNYDSIPKLSSIDSLIKQGVTEMTNEIQIIKSLMPKADSIHPNILQSINETVLNLILKPVAETAWQNSVNHEAIWDGITQLRGSLTTASDIYITKDFVPANQNQTITKVTTSEELQSALKTAVPGAIIDLAEGLYTGQFKLSEDQVVLRGQGDNTILQIDKGGTADTPLINLHILGNNCLIRGLKLLTNFTHTRGIELRGKGNLLLDLMFEGFKTAVFIYNTYGNKLSKILIQDSNRGIEISHNSTSNSLTDIFIQNGTDYGILLFGSKNTVYSFNCVRCHSKCLYIEGNDNSVKHVDIRNSTSPSTYWKIYIWKGDKNEVAFCKCSLEDDFCLKLSSGSTNVQIRDCILNKVEVQGSDHTLRSVDGGEWLKTHESGRRILVQNSRAKVLYNHGTNVTIVQSNFGD